MDHVCVGAILVDRTRLLLVRRSPTRTLYPDVWDVPGGHCEPGETLEQALARELQEEVSITPTKWRQLGTLFLTASGGDGYGSWRVT